MSSVRRRSGQFRAVLEIIRDSAMLLDLSEIQNSRWRQEVPAVGVGDRSTLKVSSSNRY